MTDGRALFTTRSGVVIDLLNPDGGLININDIAGALSNTCRFSGQVSRFYSVAQHSLNVYRVLKSLGCTPDVQLAGLLHDASEAYIADIPKPLKDHPSMYEYRLAEARLMAEIFTRFGIDPHLIENPSLVKADRSVAVAESMELFNPVPLWAAGEPCASTVIVVSEPQWHVELEFIGTYDLLQSWLDQTR